MTEEQYIEARENLEWANSIKPYLIGCSKMIVLLQSLIICKKHFNLDIDRLYEKVIKNVEAMRPYSSIAECMMSLEELYNKNTRQDKVCYIYTEYRKFIVTQHPALSKIKSFRLKERNTENEQCNN